MSIIIKDLDYYGRGVAHANGKTVFVKNALPGEEVEIKYTKEKKNFDEAVAISIEKGSDYRRKAPCPYYGICGGCNIMHINYDYQLEFKKAKVKNIIKRLAGIDVDLDILPSNEFNYRNKITLHNNGVLGYKKDSSNEIVPIEKCLLAKEQINEYLKTIEDYEHEELIIRTNDKNEIISSLKEGYIIEEINDYKFRIDINSFFQVNNYICSKVFDFISENTKEVENALDLYSGVGTLSFIASKKAKRVYSIEVNDNSYINALENIKLNNIKNVTIMHGKVEDKIKEINSNIDLIITDPPRSGMDTFTIETILKMLPKEIVYMSCEPSTLARDLNFLKNKYNIKNIRAFDMFPNTYHVECVSLLCLKDTLKTLKNNSF